MREPHADSAKHYRWNDLTAEPLKGGLTRRLITSERMMIAHVYFKKGDDVPRHAHENEQITYILEGALHFRLGADGAREVTVHAGEVLVIPSNLPHSAVALEIRSTSMCSIRRGRIGSMAAMPTFEGES